MLESASVSAGGVLVEIDRQAARLGRMRRSVLTITRLIPQGHPPGSRWRPTMVTLTYAKVGDWSPDHISEFFHRLRSWARARGVVLPYVWVAELQERGAVHYHVLVWVPVRFCLPKADRRGWWRHGSTRTEAARCAGGYLAKYVSKAESCEGAFPRGLRLSGFGGVSSHARRVRAWWLLPLYLREVYGLDADLRRARGGGWLARAWGEWIPPGWGVVAIGRGRVLVRELTSAERSLLGSPSSNPVRRWPAAAIGIRPLVSAAA